MTLAVIQMASQVDIAANLKAARALLQRAADGGAQLAVLPENFAAIGRQDVAALARQEATGDGLIVPWLQRTAAELGVWIVAGTLPLPPDDQPSGKPRACSLLVDAKGQRVARYDKLHLFSAQVADTQGQYRESDTYAPGDMSVVVADTPVGRLGLTVCYDLRFPELYTALRLAGAELISAPSAFTQVTGTAQWQPLLRARAIETQCYILAAGQGGTHAAGRQTYGHSSIVDPWGQVLCEQARGEAVLLAVHDADEQARIRQQMPVLNHRRFSVPQLVETGTWE